MASGKGREEDINSIEWSIMSKTQLKKRGEGEEFETIRTRIEVCVYVYVTILYLQK